MWWREEGDGFLTEVVPPVLLALGMETFLYLGLHVCLIARLPNTRRNVLGASVISVESVTVYYRGNCFMADRPYSKPAITYWYGEPSSGRNWNLATAGSWEHFYMRAKCGAVLCWLFSFRSANRWLG